MPYTCTMPEARTLILDHNAILTKLDRMACEICEQHSETESLIICGLNQRGFFLAEGLEKKIRAIMPEMATKLVQVDTHQRTVPEFSPVVDFKEQRVLVVDDVINTGYTLMAVLQQIFAQHPHSIGTAFLAKREHRNFPVKADYVGISLATTLQEHVHFDNSNPDALQVYLN